jgi:hypothetical protein
VSEHGVGARVDHGPRERTEENRGLFSISAERLVAVDRDERDIRFCARLANLRRESGQIAGVDLLRDARLRRGGVAPIGEVRSPLPRAGSVPSAARPRASARGPPDARDRSCGRAGGSHRDARGSGRADFRRARSRRRSRWRKREPRARTRRGRSRRDAHARGFRRRRPGPTRPPRRAASSREDPARRSPPRGCSRARRGRKPAQASSRASFGSERNAGRAGIAGAVASGKSVSRLVAAASDRRSRSRSARYSGSVGPESGRVTTESPVRAIARARPFSRGRLGSARRRSGSGGETEDRGRRGRAPDETDGQERRGWCGFVISMTSSVISVPGECRRAAPPERGGGPAASATGAPRPPGTSSDPPGNGRGFRGTEISPTLPFAGELVDPRAPRLGARSRVLDARQCQLLRRAGIPSPMPRRAPSDLSARERTRARRSRLPGSSGSSGSRRKRSRRTRCPSASGRRRRVS